MIPIRSVVNPVIKRARPEIFIVQKRHSLFNPYKHGPQKITNPDPPHWEWFKEFFTIQGQRYIWTEMKKVVVEFTKFKYYLDSEPNKLYIIEDFESDEAIKKWKTVADRDSLNGFSESKLVRSPAGHALFTGVIDNQTPDDGMTENSGFAAIIGPVAPRRSIFQMETHWDWTKFNCFEIKFRGDGRKYQIVLNTGTYSSDLQYYDNFSYFLPTRGGPYWQTVRIPFHKFVFTFKNFIQDRQRGLKKSMIKFVSINLQDKVDGPFALEIDHIGLINETNPHNAVTAYEMYAFEHLKYRPVNVDCPVPER